MKNPLVPAAIIAAGFCFSAHAQTIVKLDQGQLRGTIDQDLTVYKVAGCA